MTFLTPSGPGACVLHADQLSELRLPFQFLRDLLALLPLTGESLSDDLLKGAITRESLARKKKKRGFFTKTSTFVMVYMMLRNEPKEVNVRRYPQYRSTKADRVTFSAEMRERVRALLSAYGVTCADCDGCAGCGV